MSLLGIDIGTTGCKAVVFSPKGEQLARSYRTYEILREKDGYAELDSQEVWEKVKEAIREAAGIEHGKSIRALSVSSLGEAMVPVTRDGQILGNSILGSDERGAEFARDLENKFGGSTIFKMTGNHPGTFYSMPKISWIRKYSAELYRNTDFFLTWADFVCFMLGGSPVTNFSLAGRTLLFDINQCTWSNEILDYIGLDIRKFGPPVKSGTLLGNIKADLAHKLNLSNQVAIVSGGHDQCCAALGSGIESNSRSAMYGMGTFICVVPVFTQLPGNDSFLLHKLHIEHHVNPGNFISFIYNQSGGALIDWFRKNFYPADTDTSGNSRTFYDDMFDTVPDALNDILVIPGFGAAGPPDFWDGGKGSITGLSLQHTRGDILRAILEGITFYIRDCFERLPGAFGEIDNLVVTGGGSASRKWLQITADVLNKTILKTRVSEASSLGAAILARAGSSQDLSCSRAMNEMVHLERIFIPDPSKKEFYDSKFYRYKHLIS